MITRIMDFEMNKYEIIDSIRANCFWCDRDRAYEYISSGFFTEYELVNKYKLLTRSAFQHILKYPSSIDELDPFPISHNEPLDNIIQGNIDILFFGVCGSGGKTCLLASLMSLVGESSDFLYQEYHNNKECDNTYGPYLANYMKTNRRPPRTSSLEIHVVNTLLECDGKYQGVSFIEFAGEQVHGLAGNSIQEGMSEGNISPGMSKIFNSHNKKIIFFALDPTNLHNIQIIEPTVDHDGLWVNQSDVLSCVISQIKNNPKFIRNIIGFHCIMTKSDTWLNGSLNSCIKKAVDLSDANGLFLQIDELSKIYNLNPHINGNTGPIPFTIGKFMMGDTYEFDDSDARKLLKIIKEDVTAYNMRKSKLKNLSLKFNKFFIS